MKHRQNHYRTVAGLVTVSGLLLGLVSSDIYPLPEALANDDKVLAPQVCVPVDELTGMVEFDQALFFRDRVESASDDQLFICPLVRDLLDDDLDRIWLTLENVLPDLTVEPDTQCCVYAFDNRGVEVDFNCGSPTEAGTQVLSIDGLDSSDNGAYVVTCELDETEAIYRIRTSEED